MNVQQVPTYGPVKFACGKNRLCRPMPEKQQNIWLIEIARRSFGEIFWHKPHMLEGVAHVGPTACDEPVESEPAVHA